MTCVMMRISKEKLRLHSQGAIYFLVDLRDVRVFVIQNDQLNWLLLLHQTTEH